MNDEWRHVTERFHGFIANLRPTAAQRRRAKSAVADVANCLRPVFHPNRDFSRTGGGDHFVVGGHAKGTAIRPGIEVDMLYVLPGNLRSRADPGEEILAPLFHDLTAALGERYSKIGLSREGWLAVEPPFDPPAETPYDGRTAVRLIPCFTRPGGGYLIGDPGVAAFWRHANPKAEISRLRLANLASSHKATHLIVMLKAWRRAHGIPIPSLALELLVCEFVSLWTYHRRSLLFYDWMVRDFFFWLSHQGHREIKIPGGIECLRAGDAWLEATEAAYRRAELACRMERDNRDGEAIRRWRRIFGFTFPDTAADPMPEVFEIPPHPMPAMAARGA